MKPEYIIIHHSFTDDSKLMDWKAIKDYHIKVNGWSDIGYHYGIEGVDGKYLIMNGRNEDIEGAHCKDGGMNKKSLGICFVGNFDKYKVPVSQWDLGVLLVKGLIKKYKIPVVNVKGHGEVMRESKASYIKTCPGLLFDMIKFRKELLNGKGLKPPKWWVELYGK
jgi:N-acetylmuramoyl-L-alanine amidase